jgi:aminoglycoside adenylyltransferase-like protein
MAAARPPWPTRRPGVDRAVERLLEGVAKAVGDELVGLYLHGSLALGDFFPPASDIDFHVATAGTLDGAALERLAALHAGFKAEGGWVARLEGAYLPPAALRRLEPAGGRLPVVGPDRAFAPGRTGPTWVLDRWVTREQGVVVTGPDPRELVDPIGPAELRAAVLAAMLDDWALQIEPGADVAWLRPRGYQAFAVLTMCRNLYTLERGVLASKPAAAAWAVRRLGPPWAGLIERSLGWRADERPDDRHLPETLRFAAHAVTLARSAIGGS